MNTISKKTVFGSIAVAASGLLLAGGAIPAMAAEPSSDTTTTDSRSVTETLNGTSADTGGFDLGGLSATLNDLVSGVQASNDSPVAIAPEVGVGDVLGGDIASGNATASGNDVTAPVTAPVASGNDVAAPVASGNEVTAPVENTAPVASGNDTAVTDVVGGVTDSVDADDIVDDVMADVNLDQILGR